MNRPLSLPTFDQGRRAAEPISELMLEETRLEAFERGYKDGWEDATRAFEKEQSRLSQDLVQNLSDTAFTYHEARSAFLSDMDDLFAGLLAQVLPKLAPAALTNCLVEEVRDLISEVSDRPMTIQVPVGMQTVVAAALKAADAGSAEITETSDLSEGQARLILPPSERIVDLPVALARLADLVSRFFTEQSEPQEANHG